MQPTRPATILCNERCPSCRILETRKPRGRAMHGMRRRRILGSMSKWWRVNKQIAPRGPQGNDSPTSPVRSSPRRLCLIPEESFGTLQDLRAQVPLSASPTSIQIICRPTSRQVLSSGSSSCSWSFSPTLLLFSSKLVLPISRLFLTRVSKSTNSNVGLGCKVGLCHGNELGSDESSFPSSLA